MAMTFDEAIRGSDSWGPRGRGCLDGWTDGRTDASVCMQPPQRPVWASQPRPRGFTVTTSTELAGAAEQVDPAAAQTRASALKESWRRGLLNKRDQYSHLAERFSKIEPKIVQSVCRQGGRCSCEGLQRPGWETEGQHQCHGGQLPWGGETKGRTETGRQWDVAVGPSG